MKTRIFSALAFVIPCLSLAQPSFSNYDTIPARYRGYHYTEWYDQCPAYNNGGVIDSCSYEIYTLGRYVGEAYAKYEYTDHPIKIKGLAAMVHNETRATNFPHPNPAMAENYLYLLERIDWVDTVHPDRLGYFRMRIIDSVRFDTVKPKIMVIEQAYPGIPPSYAFVYEAYFDKPITIDSIFYIHGSFSHILNHDTDVYTHWPFDYTAVVPLKRWLSCGDCCPRNGLCQPEGQNRSLEYIDRATIYDPGYPALDTNEVWCMGWHYDPNEPFGLFFAIVDHYELKLFSDSLIMGTVEGSGFYDENDTAVFQAIPNPGFVFYQWNDGNMQNPRRLQLSHDTSFSAEFNSLGSSTPSDVTEAREGDAFAGEGVAFFADHAVDVVDGAEAGGLGTDEATAPAVALAGQSTGGVLAGEFLVGTVEVADFAAAHAHVAGRAVLVGTDVAPQFIHEGLAEAHDFGVALSNGVEVGTAFTTAEGQHGEAVFEDLLEAEEFQHADVHGLVEAETTLVGAESGVELHAVAEVGAHLAFVVDPGHAEGEDAVGLYDALDDLVGFKLGVFVVFLFDGFENLADCLQILFFTRMFGLQVGHDFIYFHVIQCFVLNFLFF